MIIKKFLNWKIINKKWHEKKKRKKKKKSKEMHSNTPISIICQKNKTQNKQVTSQSPNTVSSFW